MLYSLPITCLFSPHKVSMRHTTQHTAHCLPVQSTLSALLEEECDVIFQGPHLVVLSVLVGCVAYWYKDR